MNHFKRRYQTLSYAFPNLRSDLWEPQAEPSYHNSSPPSPRAAAVSRLRQPQILHDFLSLWIHPCNCPSTHSSLTSKCPSAKECPALRHKQPWLKSWPPFFFGGSSHPLNCVFVNVHAASTAHLRANCAAHSAVRKSSLRFVCSLLHEEAVGQFGQVNRMRRWRCSVPGKDGLRQTGAPFHPIWT